MLVRLPLLLIRQVPQQVPQLHRQLSQHRQLVPLLDMLRMWITLLRLLNHGPLVEQVPDRERTLITQNIMQIAHTLQRSTLLPVRVPQLLQRLTLLQVKPQPQLVRVMPLLLKVMQLVPRQTLLLQSQTLLLQLVMLLPQSQTPLPQRLTQPLQLPQPERVKMIPKHGLGVRLTEWMFRLAIQHIITMLNTMQIRQAVV